MLSMSLGDGRASFELKLVGDPQGCSLGFTIPDLHAMIIMLYLFRRHINLTTPILPNAAISLF